MNKQIVIALVIQEDWDVFGGPFSVVESVWAPDD